MRSSYWVARIVLRARRPCCPHADNHHTIHTLHRLFPPRTFLRPKIIHADQFSESCNGKFPPISRSLYSVTGQHSLQLFKLPPCPQSPCIRRSDNPSHFPLVFFFDRPHRPNTKSTRPFDLHILVYILLNCSTFLPSSINHNSNSIPSCVTLTPLLGSGMLVFSALRRASWLMCS